MRFGIAFAANNAMYQMVQYWLYDTMKSFGPDFLVIEKHIEGLPAARIYIAVTKDHEDFSSELSDLINSIVRHYDIVIVPELKGVVYPLFEEIFKKNTSPFNRATHVYEMKEDSREGIQKIRREILARKLQS